MKLLLTSAGFTNDAISNAFVELAGKPASDLALVFIPTAATPERGDKGWLIDDLNNIRSQGFKSVDIIDISALPQANWQKSVEETDVLFFGGGNTFYLMHWVEKSGLKDMLPKLLKTKIYVGLSAGSCIAGPKVMSPFQELFPEEKNEHNVFEGLNLVPFHIVPHLNSPHFHITMDRAGELAKQVPETTYVIDDNTALKVVDHEVSVVSEGKWKRFN